MRQSESLFLSDLPTPRQEQFRLRRLQVYNWGTFSGLHEVPIAERGFLFVGRSGSGKSTLLDAIAALLVPPLWVDFNAAAREAERSGRDRSLVSYIRGAWADRNDEESGEVATQYLRRNATWSALAVEYRNELGQCISLVRLFWLAGSTSAAADVRKHYMVAERPFDIARDLDGFDLNLRRLKQRLTDVHHHDSFNAYAERFRRLLGIEHESALRLLHKTQSAKNLGDLNAFLRDFMLERPQTFEVAERLVSEFAELDAAHQAVVTAREQIETLRPARDDYQRRDVLLREATQAGELLAGIDGFRERSRLSLLDAELEALTTKDQGLGGREQTQGEEVERCRKQLERLQDQHRAQGGGRIEVLEKEIRNAEQEREDRLRRRGDVERACRSLEWSLAATPEAFAEQVARARDFLDAGQGRRAAQNKAIAALHVEEKEQAAELRRLREEVQSLEHSRSNIPAPMQALRTRLAGALGLDDGAFPFVGELLQVLPEQLAWQGAIERLLHGFALSLLVDEKHYPRVAAWVNETRLNGKLVYFKVQRVDELMAHSPAGNSVPGKLEIKPHPHAGWLRAELQRRFDYTCVDSVVALGRQDRALTREGQIRHGRARHEKDDRKPIDDRRHWVLGFDNRDKLALFKQEAGDLGARLAEVQREIERLGKEREAGYSQSQAAQVVANSVWRDIDVAPLLMQIEELNGDLKRLREGNATLRELGTQIERAREGLLKTEGALNDTRADRKSLTDKKSTLSDERKTCAERLLDVELTPTQQEGLQARLLDLSPLTLRNLDGHFREIERGIRDRQKSLEEEASDLAHKAVNRFTEFMRRWPEDSSAFQASLEAAEDFFARLQRLEQDGLPEYEARFFDLLRSQSHQNLLALQTYISQAHKAIRARMEDVNASLERVPFNRGSILQIRVEDLRLTDVVEFRQTLAQVLSHQQTQDRELAEQQFQILRGLVARLSAQEGEQRRWREQVLDVRRHVEFIGEELDEVDRRQLEVYRSGAGKSGGQRQKLATTCLAAALRYQLGGADGGLPQYAAVVLDEAFDKADNEFTSMAMSIFENFGFQMIVATPLKSVMTLEPFIGGACFVDIAERSKSGILLIEYDEQTQRLNLPEPVRGSAELADA